MIEKELTFSWRWDNVEGVIEFYEAKQKPWIGDIQKRAVDLKEGAINAFATLFSQIPAGEGVFLYAAPTMEEPGMMSGLMAHFATIAHPIENELHPPISRVITLHPLSNPKLEHVSVYFAVTIRERVKGYLERFDFDEIKAKYRA